MLWSYLPFPVFYKGNGIFIFLLCYVVFIQNRELFISFFLLCISISNLLDEILFDPTKLQINEIVFAIIVPIIWYIKDKRNARKIHKQ